MNRGLAEIEVLSDETSHLGKRDGVSCRIIDGDGKVHQVCDGGQHLRYPAVAYDQQFGLRENGFDIDIHFAATGHSDSEQLIGHVQSNELGPPQLDTFQGFVPYRALGATAAYPS